MDRRRFIQMMLWSAAAGGIAGRRAHGSEQSLPGSMCHAPRVLRAAASPPKDHLVFEGTHILAYGAMRRLADDYPGPLPLLVRGGGCDNAIQAVRQGSAQMGGICCLAPGPGFEAFRSLTVARDIKVLIVHPSSPLRNLPSQALVGIGTGRIVQWGEVGGGAGMVALVVRQHCRGHDEPVRQILLGAHGHWSPRTLVVSDEQQLVETVARFPRSVAVASWVFAKPLVETGKVKVLSVDGVFPSPDTVRKRSYRLTSPLDIIFLEWRPRLMAPLFDFIYGSEGRRLVAERLVPVTAREAHYPPA